MSVTYEVPSAPDLVLPTHEIPIEESVERIVKELSKRGFFGSLEK
jgi:adenylylsulfate kinase-like enzyme